MNYVYTYVLYVYNMYVYVYSYVRTYVVRICMHLYL